MLLPLTMFGLFNFLCLHVHSNLPLGMSQEDRSGLKQLHVLVGSTFQVSL